MLHGCVASARRRRRPFLAPFNVARRQQPPVLSFSETTANERTGQIGPINRGQDSDHTNWFADRAKKKWRHHSLKPGKLSV